MSNNKTSTYKELRKHRKLKRDIETLKSKPHEQLNDDQKAKLAREPDVNRRIRRLENNKRNIPTPTQTPLKHVKKKKNKNNKNNKNNPAQKKNKKNKMNKSQFAAFKRHNERSKKERNEQKNKNMSLIITQHSVIMIIHNY